MIRDIMGDQAYWDLWINYKEGRKKKSGTY